MNREIKFRAWDKENKIMSGVKDLHFFTGGIDVTVACDEEDWISEPYFELMQFTGLLDKQGKEIYEGDIIRFLLPDCTWSHPQQVVYAHSSFVTKSGNLWGLGYGLDIVHSDNLKFLEVIGNIWENGELLK